MKKRNKKLLIALVIIISVTTAVFSQANAITEYPIEGVTYTYEGISAEKAEQVVKAMYGIPDEVMIQPFSIFCLFGHSLQSGMVITTEHNAYSTAPKCKETISTVDVCTRSSCDYITVKYQDTSRTGCH